MVVAVGVADGVDVVDSSGKNNSTYVAQLNQSIVRPQPMPLRSAVLKTGSEDTTETAEICGVGNSGGEDATETAEIYSAAATAVDGVTVSPEKVVRSQFRIEFSSGQSSCSCVCAYGGVSDNHQN